MFPLSRNLSYPPRKFDHKFTSNFSVIMLAHMTSRNKHMKKMTVPVVQSGPESKQFLKVAQSNLVRCDECLTMWSENIHVFM